MTGLRSGRRHFQAFWLPGPGPSCIITAHPHYIGNGLVDRGDMVFGMDHRQCWSDREHIDYGAVG